MKKGNYECWRIHLVVISNFAGIYFDRTASQKVQMAGEIESSRIHCDIDILGSVCAGGVW